MWDDGDSIPWSRAYWADTLDRHDHHGKIHLPKFVILYSKLNRMSQMTCPTGLVGRLYVTIWKWEISVMWDDSDLNPQSLAYLAYTTIRPCSHQANPTIMDSSPRHLTPHDFTMSI